MKRNMKTLGLALGAVLALGALFAAGASAQGERFHSTEKNVILTGEGGPSRFHVGKESTTKGITVKCEVSTYEGTVEGEELNGEIWTTKEVTVHPIYHECDFEFEGLGKTTVHTDGCDYILTSEYKEEHAPVEVECTEGFAVEIAAEGCTIKIGSIPEETLTTGVTYANVGEGHNKTLTVDSTVDNIPYTSAGFLCGIAGIAKEAEDGFYEDDVVVEGMEDRGWTQDPETHEWGWAAGEVGIWWE